MRAPRRPCAPRVALATATLLAVLAQGARAQPEPSSATAEVRPDPDPAAVLATLPFLDGGPEGAVFVDVAPADARRRLPLQLDTGASASVLTPDLARELGVRMRRSKRTAYRRGTVLGRDLEFFVADRRGETGYGLLGGNFLAAYVVEVDWGERRVRFLDPARFQVPETAAAPDEAVLPMQIVGNRPVVEIGLAGGRLPALLDTGASFGVLLGAAAASRLGIRGQPTPGLRAVGVRGPIDVEFVELEKVALGPLEFARVPAVVAPEGLRQQGTANDSLVGQDLLSTCTVRIDYPRRRLWLRRRPGALPRFLGASWPSVRGSGALLYRQGERVYVGVVLPEGPAADRGLRPGDVLADVDAGAPDFDARHAHALVAGDAPLRVRRVDARGRALTLSLAPATQGAPANHEREPGSPADAP